MKIALRSTLAAGALLACAAALAQPAPRFDARDIDSRQARQAVRIDQAFARGALDRHELRRLRGEQREIARYEARARADGFLDRTERRHLEAMLDRADTHIRIAIRRG